VSGKEGRRPAHVASSTDKSQVREVLVRLRHVREVYDVLESRSICELAGDLIEDVVEEEDAGGRSRRRRKRSRSSALSFPELVEEEEDTRKATHFV